MYARPGTGLASAHKAVQKAAEQAKADKMAQTFAIIAKCAKQGGKS